MIINATDPEESAVLMAPLEKSAGGWGSCPNVFKSKEDEDYKIIEYAAKNWQKEWQKAGRFGSPTFQVNRQYIRELVRFGVLPENISPDKINPYETDRLYWKTFEHDPQKQLKQPQKSQISLR